MNHSAKKVGFGHFKSHCHRISTNNGTLYDKVFSNSIPLDLLGSLNFRFRSRVYTPLVTVWVFINQILSADHSCRYAVTSLIAVQSSLGEKIVSSATGAYCRARLRLPTKFLSDWIVKIGQKLRQEKWLWKDFEVLLVDGTVVSLPDTKNNQKVFSKPSNSFGLLKMRMLGIFSLTTGAVVDFKWSPWCGQGTGEVALFQKLSKALKPMTLLLMDRLFGDYQNLFLLHQQGIDFVIRRHASHRSDFRTGQRLGKNDHLIDLTWKNNRFTLREVGVVVKCPGFRSKKIFLITSLTNQRLYSLEEISSLFNQRWNVEVDFRSLKSGLNMDVLRAKTPEMVEKEALMHLLAYNLIRTVMTEAGVKINRQVRDLSFKEALQLIQNFRLLIATANPADQKDLYMDLLTSMKDIIGNRPNRIEPRLIKHSHRKYGLLKIPREKARKGFWKKGQAGQKKRTDERSTNM